MPRWLGRLVEAAPERLRPWLEAAVAEREQVPAGLPRLEWTLGLITMLGGHMLLHLVFPWLRAPGERRAYGVAALLGLALMLPAAWATAVGWRGLDGLAGYAILAAVLLGLWLNVGVVWNGRHLGGTYWQVGVRGRLTNLALVIAAGVLVWALFAGPFPHHA